MRCERSRQRVGRVSPVPHASRRRRVVSKQVHSAVARPYARAVPTLLERTHELATLEAASGAVNRGEGAMITVTGRAGLGKTRLLEAALAMAGAQGLRCARARAGELERDLGWGVAVDVVEGLIGELTTEERAVLLGGRARHAATVLEDDGTLGELGLGRSAAAQQAAIVAALTLVVGRVAAGAPLAIVIDDLHWADGPSLRWLCHLAARVDRMRVLLVVGFRSHEPGASAMLASLDATASTTLRPAPLTPSATARLVDLALDHGADAPTRDAVHEVTAGNPFLINQLMRHLESGPVTADAVWNARPERLAALVIPRLSRLGADAKALSDAVAVLGVDSSLRHAAELAGISRAAAVRAAERLSATGFFDDRLPLTFAHPLLREVVKAGLGAARGDELRRSAAGMLARSEADPTAGAVQLLAAEPVGEPWAGRLLHAAGHHEMRRAAYDGAAAFFERALLEPLEDVPRHSVTLFLGRALLLAGRDEGLDALRQALEQTPDQVERATVALEVGSALMAVDQPQQAVEVYESGLGASGELGESLKIDLLAQRALAMLAFRDQPERAIGAVAAALEATAGAPGAAGRAAIGLSAIVAVWMGESAAHCTELSHQALATPPYGAADSPEWTPDLAWVCAALAWCDAHEQREPFLDDVIERARERGAMLNVAGAAASRSHGRMRQGRVADAEADARLAMQIYLDLDDAHHAMESAFLLDPLIARGALAEADQLLAAAPPHRDDDQVVYLALLDARARLRIAQGRPGDARQDLELLRAEVEEQGFGCPAAVAWRPQLAVVLHALGEHAAGRALAAEDLERTRAFGAPRALGLALLATAATSPPQAARAALVEATEILAAGPARLEYARALVELGALTRRIGQRSEAVALLRQGLDRASSCGAGALVVRARDELRVAGARPRRERVSGPESLTAAERRVGELAAGGASNADIARSLVVSLRTVETHLTSVYRKLDIKRRDELGGLLTPEPAPPATGDRAKAGAAVIDLEKPAPDGFYHPEREEDIVALVRYARANRRKIRVRGAGHSVAHAIYADPLSGIANKVKSEPDSSRRAQHQRRPRPARGLHREISGAATRRGPGRDAFGRLRRRGEADMPDGPAAPAEHARGLDALRHRRHRPPDRRRLHCDRFGWRVASALRERQHLRLSAHRRRGRGVRGQKTVDPEFDAMVPNFGLLGIVSTVTFRCEEDFYIAGMQTTSRAADAALDLSGDAVSLRTPLREFLEKTPYGRIEWWPQRGADRVVVWEASRNPGLPTRPRRRNLGSRSRSSCFGARTRRSLRP